MPKLQAAPLLAAPQCLPLSSQILSPGDPSDGSPSARCLVHTSTCWMSHRTILIVAFLQAVCPCFPSCSGSKPGSYLSSSFLASPYPNHHVCNLGCIQSPPALLGSSTLTTWPHGPSTHFTPRSYRLCLQLYTTAWHSPAENL